MVVAAVVVVEHLPAGFGPIALVDRPKGQGGALGTQTTGDALGGFPQGLLAQGAIDGYQALHPFIHGPLDFDGRGLAHLGPETSRDTAPAHLGTFRLQPERAIAGALPQGKGQQVFVVLIAWLGRQPQAAKTAAPVIGEPFEIHHGGAAPVQFQEQICLSSSGASTQHQQVPWFLHLGQHPVAKTLVAPLQQHHGQLQGARQPGHAG